MIESGKSLQFSNASLNLISVRQWCFLHKLDTSKEIKPPS